MRFAERGETDMKSLYTLIGAPGSGKSTWARNNALLLNADIVCSDQVRIDFQSSSRDPLDGDAVFAEVERRARDLPQADRSIILDATHYHRKYRIYAIKLAREYQARSIAVWLDVPLEVCRTRNQQRDNRTFGEEHVPDDSMRNIWEHLQPPRDDEFDEVVKVSGDQLSS
jgi:protein phosphatase